MLALPGGCGDEQLPFHSVSALLTAGCRSQAHQVRCICHGTHLQASTGTWGETMQAKLSYWQMNVMSLVECELVQSALPVPWLSTMIHWLRTVIHGQMGLKVHTLCRPFSVHASSCASHLIRLHLEGLTRIWQKESLFARASLRCPASVRNCRMAVSQRTWALAS